MLDFGMTLDAWIFKFVRFDKDMFSIDGLEKYHHLHANVIVNSNLKRSNNNNNNNLNENDDGNMEINNVSNFYESSENINNNQSKHHRIKSASVFGRRNTQWNYQIAHEKFRVVMVVAKKSIPMAIDLANTWNLSIDKVKLCHLSIYLSFFFSFFNVPFVLFTLLYSLFICFFCCVLCSNTIQSQKHYKTQKNKNCGILSCEFAQFSD